MNYIMFKKVGLWTVGLLLLWFVSHTFLIIVDGLNDSLEKADLAVVFGNEVNVDGHPSPRLQARLDKAVEV